jgi:hypothetical protein
LKRKRSEAGWVTLIELLVVVTIIVIVVTLLYGRQSPMGAGGVTSPSGQARTAPGAALEQARALECQQNLRGLREMISAYRIDNEQPPLSLSELRAGGATTCPVSGNPYVYDPTTGTVRCTTPGHENL